jgi:hypothetical protein
MGIAFFWSFMILYSCFPANVKDALLKLEGFLINYGQAVVACPFFKLFQQ